MIVVAADLLPKLPSAVRRRDTTQVIHNAIVLEDYTPAGQRETIRRQYGLAPDDFVLGVIGRLNPEKRVFRFRGRPGSAQA